MIYRFVSNWCGGSIHTYHLRRTLCSISNVFIEKEVNMRYLVYLISSLLSLGGLALVVSPDVMRRFYLGMTRKLNFKLASLCSLAIGLILLFAAGGLRFPLFARALGLMSIIKGVVMLSAKKKTLNEMMEWWSRGPAIVYRMWGVCALLLGFILFKTII